MLSLRPSTLIQPSVLLVGVACGVLGDLLAAVQLSVLLVGVVVGEVRGELEDFLAAYVLLMGVVVGVVCGDLLAAVLVVVTLSMRCTHVPPGVPFPLFWLDVVPEEVVERGLCLAGSTVLVVALSVSEEIGSFLGPLQ